MKCFKFCILCSLLMGLSLSPAQSEFYEYIDENGVRSYTDDSSVMSMPQRETAQTLPEVVSNPQSSPIPMGNSPQKRLTMPGDNRATAKPVAMGADVPLQSADNAALEAEADALKQVKSNLDREYSRLQSEKQRLTNLRDELRVADKVSVETMDDFRKQVNILNQETADYEKKLMDFMTRVSKYNKKIQ